MIHISNKKVFITVIACLYYLLRFVNCFIPTSQIFILLFTLVEAMSLLLLSWNRVKIGATAWVVMANITVAVFSMAIHGSNNITEIVFTILALSMAYYMALYGIERKHAIHLYIIITAVLVFRIITTGSVNAVFLVASRNNISAFSILASILLYSTYEKDENLPYIPALITLVLSCVGEGRGGVVSAIFLMIGVLFLNITGRKHIGIKKTIYLIVLLIVVGILFTKFYDKLFYEAISRLTSQKLIENERVEILQNYYELAKNSFSYALFGVPRNDIALVNYLNGNFHNSYLSLHNMFGIVGVITIICLAVKSTVHSIKISNWLLVVLMLSLLLRAYTDDLCFVGYYDSLLYYLFFLCNQKAKVADSLVKKQTVTLRKGVSRKC